MKKVFFALVLICLSGCGNNVEKEPTSENPLASTSEKEDTSSFFIGKDYLIDDQHSYIGFKIKYFGFSPVRGRFNEFDGTVFYDPENVNNTSMSIFINVNSINTGNERRDNDLITGTSWFNEIEFKYITFESHEVTLNEDGSFLLEGDFTMNGITMNITIPFEKPTSISMDWAANEQVDYSGKITINRKDFGVYGGDFWDSLLEKGVTQLSDEVEIELDIHTRRGDYQERYAALEEDNVRKIVLDVFKGSGAEDGVNKIETLHKNEETALSSGALTTIGKTLQTWEMYEEAIVLFMKGTELYPDKASLHTNLGISYLLNNQEEKAIKQLKIALEMDPANSRAAAYLKLLE